MDAITHVLNAIEQGDPSAAEQLLPLVYDELRRLADQKLARERPDHTLQPTALVHEAYIRLVGSDADAQWSGRGHFFAAAAEAMRRILVDAARHKQSQKAGGGLRRVELVDAEPAVPGLDLDLVALDEALAKLERKDPRKAQLVKLRFFAGLTLAEIAATEGISLATVEREWQVARAWLFAALTDAAHDDA